jgi:hypothetical protein
MQALIGAGAALGGVLLTGIFGLILDQRRRRWEKQTRWDDARRKVYVEFLYTSRVAFVAANRLAMLAIDQLEHPLPSDHPELLQRVKALGFDGDEIDRWGHQLNQASAEIALIASERVSQAAHAEVNLYGELLELLHELEGNPTVSADELRARMQPVAVRSEETHEAFMREVRRELQIDL